ncbi:MAG TPA: biotin--[acetyl-CoA-carboxylase] ligase [Gemmatimonadaceae bacterium]|nr:biotin--[acetyl-CoA-carboxylase] ligase [Gemmatimonadaceae bacterium]
MYPSSDRLARELGLPRVELYESVGSTLDVAHGLAAAGAPAGTLVLAAAQTAGRGRLGRSWSSEPGAGIWLTLIERPADRSALDVLSLRVGLGIVNALEPLTGEALALKWPNDVYRGDRKLAGILVEARWRGSEPDWVAIGVGLNVRAPSGQPRATGLESTGVSRNAVLFAIVPALRRAASLAGPLTRAEVDDFTARDVARGRAILEPVRGTVDGINAAGGLRVLTKDGLETLQAGTLVFEGDQ